MFSSSGTPTKTSDRARLLIVQTIIAFGDSTTAARFPLEVYPERLHTQLTTAGYAVNVVNSGVRGDHTDGAVARLETDVLQRRPQVVIVQFGLNDAAVDVWKTPPASGPRISLETFTSNLAMIVQAIQRAGATPILMTPNPLAWTPQLRLLYGKPPYEPESHAGFNRVLTAYVEAVQRMAESAGVRCVDIFGAFRTWTPGDSDPGAPGADAYTELLLDGMHPNDKGQELIAACLMPVVAKVLDARA